MRKINYLNNKDILKEIHKSKSSYCSFLDPSDHQYDIIISDLSEIPAIIPEAKAARANRLTKLAYDTAVEEGKKVKLSEFEIDPETINETDLVFRLMTWDHIPTVDTIAPDNNDFLSDLLEEETDPDLAPVEVIAIPPKFVKVNFPPFQHFKIDANRQPYCVGKSHWKGDLTTGKYSRDHGTMTNKLAHMFIKLCERYATRSNWRGYCVDTKTEALTQRGWLTGDQITEQDIILSYSDGSLKWSTIKSIYRGHFDGLMHKLTNRGIDALVTPEHKFVTDSGLVKVEFLKNSDKLIVLGNAECSNNTKQHPDALVELIGWVIANGKYEVSNYLHTKKLVIYANQDQKADRVRNCLNELNFKFSETTQKNKIRFAILNEHAKTITDLIPNNNLTTDFILSLTAQQRETLVNTIVNGNGQQVGKLKWFSHKNSSVADMFQMLCTLAGNKTNMYLTEKSTPSYKVALFSARRNSANVSYINFHGGKTKYHNDPTTYYNGMVWCPETEYGNFVARRNGKVYLTGNTYSDEMKSQALLQLSQIGLQFDESKSDNPFGYYTSVITNSFTRVLNIEKRNQNLRDDILELNSLTPSYTRQNSGGSNHNEDHD